MRQWWTPRDAVDLAVGAVVLGSLLWMIATGEPVDLDGPILVVLLAIYARLSEWR